MVAFRSRRIESLFGVSLEGLTEAEIQSLVTNQVEESYDLDFKEELYGSNDSAKRSLAGDIAAMANTAGGVIVLGVSEDTNARASSAPGVVLTDAEAARMLQIAASLIAPLPQFDIMPVVGSAKADHGFYVIAVPKSPASPHAVLVNDGLRYPRRNGATTRYLSEPEVAAAYRERLLGATRQGERLDRIEVEAKELLRLERGPWLMLSLVPDLPGHAQVGQSELQQFTSQVLGKEAWKVVPRGVSFRRARVGRRRLVADGGHDSPLADWVLAEYHSDGSGTHALRLGDLHERARNERARNERPEEADNIHALVDDEMLVAAIITGLLRLAEHARDRAMTGGNAVVRAHLLPSPEVKAIEIGHSRMHGFPESRSQLAVAGEVIPAEASADLDDLAAPGPALAATAAQLANELAQSFGIAELGQLTTDGKFRTRYWSNRATGGRPQQWAEANGIGVIEETL